MDPQCAYCEFYSPNAKETLIHTAANHLFKTRYECQLCTLIFHEKEFVMLHIMEAHLGGSVDKLEGPQDVASKSLPCSFDKKSSAATGAADATEVTTANSNQRIIPYFQQINNQFVPTSQHVVTAGQRAAAVAATAAYPQVTFQTAAPTAAAVAAAAAQQPNWNEVRLNVGRLEYATGGKVVGYKSVIETHIQSQLEKQQQQAVAAAGTAASSHIHVLAAGGSAAAVGVTGAIPGGEHKCKKCELSFAQKTQLRSHVRAAHMKPRTFACEHCGKMFCSKHNKEVHVDSVHLKITHKCQYCGKVFTQKNNLFSHVKAEHGGGVKR